MSTKESLLPPAGETLRSPVSRGGLTAVEVEKSRALHGANVLTPPEREPWWKLYLEKFEDPVIRILLIAAFISFAVGLTNGHWIEAIGIVIAVFLATGLAFLNEYRANAEFDVLNQTSDDVAVKVMREGRVTTVARKDVVVGDLVLLEQGDEIPADGQVLETVSLEVNESSLTGEVVPVTKVPEAGGAWDGHGTYPPHEAKRGTMVVDGSGLMVVEAVGDASEIGRTARAAAEETDEKSPLNQQLERLSKWIGVIGFGIAMGTFFALIARAVLLDELLLSRPEWVAVLVMGTGVGILLSPVWLPLIYDFFDLTGRRKEAPEWLDEGAVTWLKAAAVGVLAAVVLGGVAVALGQLSMSPASWLPLAVVEKFLVFFMIAVTIVVVAVPEGLAMSVTLSLAYSMRRMTAQNCLVRRMDATETIGAATHILSDKTGTLTMNQMRVQAIHLGEGAMGEPEPGSPYGTLFAESVAVNGTANLGVTEEGVDTVIGNPTEGALLLWLKDEGTSYEEIRSRFRRLAQLPFSTERKYMGTIGEGVRGRVLHIKGAPDIVIGHCTHFATADGGAAPLTPLIRQEIEAGLKAAQGRAMRTLGFAYREMATEEGHEVAELVSANNLVWLGYVAIADPVRAEVPAAVLKCQGAGIGVKIVTGDNPETAKEIARQIGLWKEGDDERAGLAMLGPDFAALSDEEAVQVAPALKVLARARPADKLKLVRAVERAGGVVAVTGDGTNDAPALNYAAVGLSMGKNGTAVAKEASDIVILDDSFGSIATAVKWGRSLYLNIQKFIVFQLTINVAACGIALLGPFIGVELPLTVMQMLWVNLIMDTFAALALATEPPEEGVMEKAPRKSTDFIVSPEMRRAIFGTGIVFILLLILALKRPFFGTTTEPEHLTAFFTFFVLLQFWNQFNARTLGSNKSAFSGLRENPWFLVILAAILAGQVLIVTLGGNVFRVVPLSLDVWVKILLGTSLVLWVGEAIRFWKRRGERAVAV